MSKRMNHGLVLLSLLLSSVFLVVITIYFIGIKQEPVMPTWCYYFALFYTVLQMIKRSVYKQQGRFDWIYYVGLMMLALPVFMEDPFIILPYRWSLIFGVFSTVLPVVIDSINWIKDSNK